MDVFEKLKAGIAVDMLSPEYRPAVDELHRADKALFHVNHSEPGSQELTDALNELFAGEYPEGLGLFTPVQIDFPKQMTFGKRVFINHHFTAMSIGGINIGDHVQIGPNVTIVTDNHDFANRYILKCKLVNIGNNVWIGANAVIMPGVTIGDNAVVAGGALVTKDVPSDCVAGGSPAKVLKYLKQEKELSKMNVMEEKFALKELCDTFSVLADEMKLHEQSLLFTENGTLTAKNNGNVSHYEGREAIEESCTKFMNLFEIHFHNNGQALFDIIDDTHATGTAYNETILIGNGKITTNGIVYHDRYEKVDGKWLIAARESNFVWSKTEDYNR